MTSNPPERQQERRRKYDLGADDYSERFADPGAIVRWYLWALSSWGAPVRQGDEVIELGCADGFVTLALASAGYRVTAVDLSPRMIEVARERLARGGFDARFIVADIREMEPVGSPAAVLGLMRSFFSYVEDPSAVLQTLARLAPKVLVDADPRTTDLASCETTVHDAGFASVAHRPMFVPTRYHMPAAIRATLRAAELTPGLRSLILRRKFLVAIKGERG
jgi:SAM-dependent methyltransferase